MRTEARRGINKWIDEHPILDETLGMRKKNYIMAYQTLSQSGNACVVIDIKADAIREFLQGIDFGEGSIVGFVTAGGSEIVCENKGESEESIFAEGEKAFFGQSFYPAADTEELQGVEEVSYKGGKYMFFYNRSELNGAIGMRAGSAWDYHRSGRNHQEYYRRACGTGMYRCSGSRLPDCYRYSEEYEEYCNHAGRGCRG